MLLLAWDRTTLRALTNKRQSQKNSQSSMPSEYLSKLHRYQKKNIKNMIKLIKILSKKMRKIIAKYLERNFFIDGIVEIRIRISDGQ